MIELIAAIFSWRICWRGREICLSDKQRISTSKHIEREIARAQTKASEIVLKAKTKHLV